MNTITAPDALLEQAWATRMNAYRAYNALPFGEGDQMSPDEARQWADIEGAEEAIRSTLATTNCGVAIQLWVALYHCLHMRDDCEAVQRGDLAALAAREGDWDWHARLIVAALRSLEAMEA